MSEKLTANFLNEIFKLCFVKNSFIEVAKDHLKFQYIPVELKAYKLILQSILNQYDLSGGKLPSFGIVSQQYSNNTEVQNTLSNIKSSDIIDTGVALKQLFEFIRDSKLQIVLDESVAKYNKGEKEEALKIFQDGAEEIQKFSLSSSKGQFLKVFADFKQQLKERQEDQAAGDQIHEKVPFSIDIVDNVTDGGLDRTDIALWIMRSGVGKSTALKHSGMAAARLGYRVLHIQLEGSKKEAFDKYTQIWTGTTYSEVKWGDIPREKMVKIDKVLMDLQAKNRDLEIFSFEKFGMASMVDIRDLVIEYNKVNGVFPDLVIIDSLDLLITGINKKIDFDPSFKKDKLQTVAQLMKNLAVEFNTRVLTATQTGSVPKENWNNPDWVITRDNTEGDRTLVKPFSYVLTGNQTVDEQKKNILRVHFDKFRNYNVKDSTYPICSAFNVGKFYDKVSTLKLFSYMYEDK